MYGTRVSIPYVTLSPTVSLLLVLMLLSLLVLLLLLIAAGHLFASADNSQLCC